jgi:epoxide hydrolase 4
LHYIEAGDGPLIVLLHGFPEFWYGWRQQIQPLAAADVDHSEFVV